MSKSSKNTIPLDDFSDGEVAAATFVNRQLARELDGYHLMGVRPQSKVALGLAALARIGRIRVCVLGPETQDGVLCCSIEPGGERR